MQRDKGSERSEQRSAARILFKFAWVARMLTYAICISTFAVTVDASVPSSTSPFLSARPIWPAGRSHEMNVQAGFRTVVRLTSTTGVRLRLTASTLYRATVNGKHVGYGPARGPHGYYRVDVLDLSRALRAGLNVIAIEVAGYNANSYYTIDQPSFLQAEVVRGSEVLAATGVRGFECGIITERLQKVQRYSFQRPFSEVYQVSPDHDMWKTDPSSRFSTVLCSEERTPRRYLERRVPYPDFALRHEPKLIFDGTLEKLPSVPGVWKDRSLTAIGPKLKGYLEAELAVIPSIEMQQYRSLPPTARNALKPAGNASSIPLGENRYAILDFGLNDTGFVGATVHCAEQTTLVFAFDEVLHDGDVDFKRLGCVNLVQFELPPGTFRLESFEPYTFRYLKPMVLRGRCEISSPYIREYACSGVESAKFRASDPRLEKLFNAGRETFRQNAVDVFMDCPSRERAGWLCDSFFTARVCPDLRGDTSIERNQMENFLLPDEFAFLPDGMLPMCYPSDHNDGVYIPNWAMWFVVQLDEYLKRTGDITTVNRLKPRVSKLLKFLEQFRNSDGLLEKLPSWVFIEWSDANNHVQDVNYPSNMLYAGTLAAAGRLYGLADLTAEAERVRNVIRRQSFDGTFFVDNGLRRSGTLQITKNHTEVCQYYAFFFGVASPQTHPALWAALRDSFGPKRMEKKLYPDVPPANSFIGNMLRIELLSREGLSQQILDESIDYLLYMAERTGTLWENVGDYASCNHGFASHIVHTLYRDVLGARDVDNVHKRVRLRFAPTGLAWCEGDIPTPHGMLHLSWRKAGDAVVYRCVPPKGYGVEVENVPGVRLIKESVEKRQLSGQIH